MKPDWDKLMSAFDGSTSVAIADVDCTAAGKSKCDEVGVRGYPTIKYGDPNDLQDYKGGRDFDALKKFAETELGPGCGVDTKENCSAEQLKELEVYIAMPADERAAKLASMKKALEKADEDHNELLKKLQAQFKESQDAVEKLKEESTPVMKLLRAATPKAPASGKDEV